MATSMFFVFCWIERRILAMCAALPGWSLFDTFLPTVCLYGSHDVTKRCLMLTTPSRSAVTPQ
jgi:hypothetical protein